MTPAQLEAKLRLMQTTLNNLTLEGIVLNSTVSKFINTMHDVDAGMDDIMARVPELVEGLSCFADKLVAFQQVAIGLAGDIDGR